ncbi:MAG: circularly permuted type 2 ATP-grasp protein [Planctomycetota bacterium]|nr:circularly permuted type 2 ATP-grasp protein [Planctomycetota bacterium]MDA1178351.1 circularly permuted type 2 ATP-grasp protein [Planctomycetota bacterium]
MDDILQHASVNPGEPIHPAFFATYASPRGAVDELLLPDGNLRAHWARFSQSLSRMGRDEISRRSEQAQRLIHENGIAYSAYGDPAARLRPWELDPVPLLVPANEWQTVADGLTQRALLWDMVLTDLYGPQHLVRNRALPPEVIFRHPGFQRPFHRPQSGPLRHLQCYAADLARNASGQWCVWADRSEAPSGAGFALENRIVISRMFPGIFRDCCVERLAPYFVAFRETMRQMAPRHRDNPRIVWLGQGPQSANFFEDAYLARYLGYALVEADDLAVRGNEVMLKTLSGLLPVDVIIRRINSEHCDPLELESAGTQGVAGLLQAVRSGNVAVVNELGSGLIESPIFMAMMPELSQVLLGEDLKLPGISTWWCGDPESKSFVLQKLDDLVVKPAFRQRGADRMAIQRFNTMPPDQIRSMIEQDPAGYIAQERAERSSVPSWRGTEFVPSYMALRTYLIASADTYVVMPGGLTRTSTTERSLETSILAGEGSKDTWILSDGPVDVVSLLASPSDSLQLRRSPTDLPSRVADNLFWMGRQLERVESSARLLRTVVVRLTSETGSPSVAEIPALLRLLAMHGQIEPGFVVQGIQDRLPAIEQALPTSVFDTKNQAGCLRAVLNEATRIASLVRDRLSSDTWRILLHMDRSFHPSDQPDLTDLLNLVNQLLMDLAALSGLVMESMTRTQAFRFLDLGRRLEKSLQILQFVQECFGSKKLVPNELLEAALEIGDSLMTYRARYLAQLQMSAVLDLLLTDETNPRSLAFQLVAICAHVDNLPRDANLPGYALEQRIAMSLLHSVRMADLEDICESHQLGDPGPLLAFVGPLLEQLPKLSNAVSHRYLVHAGPSQKMADIPRNDDQA